MHTYLGNGVTTFAMRALTLALLCAGMIACGEGDKPATKAVTPGIDANDDQDGLLGTDSGGEDDAVDTEDSGASDTGDDAGTDEVVDDDAGDVTLDTADSGPLACPTAGAAGCPCASVSDCDSGFCIDTPKGQKCAQVCSDKPCPEDSKCQSTSGSGGDIVNICVPKYGKICNPCNTNAECQGPGSGDAHCVDQGNNGAFCGSACKASDECPAGYECSDTKDVAGAAVKQCIVKGGAACSCTENAITLELSTNCFVQAQGSEAKCAGKRTCLADGKPNAPKGGGLSGCYAPEPKPEECDGKDNDCNGQTDETTCDDKNPCTSDLCKGAGGCQNQNQAGPCDADGSVCTKDDKCVNGACSKGDLVICDDKNLCTDDVCDAAKGCTATDNEKACDADNNECTESDACSGGKCVAGALKACNSGDQCIEAKCNIITGGCKYTAQDGTACNDGSSCTSADKCTKVDDSTSKCGGENVNCDDKNPCTADSCDQTKGCLHANLDGGACNDYDACTENDLCGSAKCAGTGIDIAKKCDDNNPCTIDTCKPDNGCINKVTGTDGKECDDGNPCTAGDACLNGTCAAGSNKCKCLTDLDCEKSEDGNFCNGILYCDKSVAGAFQCSVDVSTVKKCDASVNNSCQSNDCEPATGKCLLNKKQTGLPCDADGTLCTQNDACADGKCVSGKVQICDDNNECTDDSCDPTKGCVYAPNNAPCNSDSNACTVNDSCVAGSCVAGKLKVCDDLEACTKDACNDKTALCTYSPLTQSCTDDNVCTSGDACATDAGSGKYTCVPGKAISCDDDNTCTQDSCNKLEGCKHPVDVTVKAACYSGDPKTANKGQCKDGSKVCNADATFGECLGSVLPATKELCDGIDDTCDGVTDEGCKPTAFSAHYGSAVVAGSGTKFATRVTVGGSSVVGESKGGGTYSAKFGYYQWIKALLGL